MTGERLIKWRELFRALAVLAVLQACGGNVRDGTDAGSSVGGSSSSNGVVHGSAGTTSTAGSAGNAGGTHPTSPPTDPNPGGSATTSPGCGIYVDPASLPAPYAADAAGSCQDKAAVINSWAAGGMSGRTSADTGSTIVCGTVKCTGLALHYNSSPAFEFGPCCLP